MPLRRATPASRSPMRAWLRDAGAAAAAVGEASGRWLAGTLAALAFLGWLPLLLAVAPLPSAADLAFFGADLYTSSLWPLNAVLLLAGVATLGLLACWMAALGAAAVLRGEGLLRGPRLGAAVSRIAGVQLLAALPALAVLVALGATIAVVAPGEYQSPDIGGPVELRILRDVLGLVIVLPVAVLVGQLLGAVASRRVAAGMSVAAAMRSAAVTLGRRPGPLAAVGVVTFVVQLLDLAATAALLHLLWVPIGAQLARGLLGSPATLLLLVGFVAIWLCLLVAAGVVFAWASAWWSIALGRQPEEESRRA